MCLWSARVHGYARTAGRYAATIHGYVRAADRYAATIHGYVRAAGPSPGIRPYRHARSARQPWQSMCCAGADG